MKLKQTGKLAPITKPWQLIRDAVNDLVLQEKTACVRVNMGYYHIPLGQQCSQCLAGCSISRRLNISTTLSVSPSLLPRKYRSRLFALDWFRRGEIRAAYAELNLQWPSERQIPLHVYVPSYLSDPSGFKASLRYIARSLERAHNGKPATRIR